MSSNLICSALRDIFRFGEIDYALRYRRPLAEDTATTLISLTLSLLDSLECGTRHRVLKDFDNISSFKYTLKNQVCSYC